MTGYPVLTRTVTLNASWAGGAEAEVREAGQCTGCFLQAFEQHHESSATAVQQLSRDDQGKDAGVTVYQPDGVLAHTCGLSGVSTVVSAWVESWRTVITQPALNVLIFII